MTEGHFVDDGVDLVNLGSCRCKGSPHPSGDLAAVWRELGWDDMVDIGLAPTQGASRLLLVTRAIRSWNLLDEEGEPIPVNEQTVRRLRNATLNRLADRVNETYKRSGEPDPNGSGEPSQGSPPESGSQDQDTPSTERPTS